MTQGSGDAVRADTPRRPRPEQLGQAFCELIERLDPTRLPTVGGLNATVVLLLDYHQLLSALGTAHLDTGEPISADPARHLAWEAGLIPTVYHRLVDGRSVLLDMGHTPTVHRTPTHRPDHRTRRLHHRRLRPPRRRVPRPPRQPLDERRPHRPPQRPPALPHDHSKAHSTSYSTKHHPNGKITLHRRT